MDVVGESLLDTAKATCIFIITRGKLLYFLCFTIQGFRKLEQICKDMQTRNKSV